MKNGVYCLFNRLSCRFGAVISYPTDGFAVRSVKKDFIERQSADMDEIILYRIGEMDISTGVLTPCVPTPLSWDDSLPTESEAEKID